MEETNHTYEIIPTKWGIANRYPNYKIEIHEKLWTNKIYEKLYDEIINHEMNHSEGFNTLKDLLLDLRGFNNKKLYYKFIFTTPSSWVQFSPIYRSSWGKWFLDFNLLIFYCFFLLFIFLTWIII